MRFLHAAVCLLAAGASAGIGRCRDRRHGRPAGSCSRAADYEIGADLGTPAPAQPVPQLRALLAGHGRDARPSPGRTAIQQRDQPGDRRRALRHRRHAALDHPGRRLFFINPAGVVFGPNAAPGRRGLVPRQHRRRAALRRRRRYTAPQPGRQLASPSPRPRPSASSAAAAQRSWSTAARSRCRRARRSRSSAATSRSTAATCGGELGRIEAAGRSGDAASVRRRWRRRNCRWRAYKSTVERRRSR